MKALIVIDAQNDFCAPGGALTNEYTQAAVPYIKELVKQFYNRYDAIYYTRDCHSAEYLNTQEGKYLPIPHCQFGSWGWRIVEGVDMRETPNNSIHHLNKNTFGYSHWGDEHLDQYEEIIICGFVSSICVLSNALIIKSLYPELPIKFAAYASAGLSLGNHAVACEVMRSCQIKVIEDGSPVD